MFPNYFTIIRVITINIRKGPYTMLKKQLLTQIELKRSELIEIAMKHGFSSSSAIICSQELDVLLNKYNEMNLKKEFPNFRKSKEQWNV